MKKLLLILTNLLITAASFGQAAFTTVTGTLVDSSGQVWSNATVIAQLRPAPNNPALPLNNGTSITDSPQTVVTDNTGTFTLILDRTSAITPAGALWTFTVYPNASVQNGSSISLPISGATQNISGVFSSILIVPSVFAAPAINRAYTDGQVTGGTGGIYWNTTQNALKGCVLVGVTCTWVTIGNLTAPGSHFYVPYNNGSSAFTASINLQFNDLTNTFSTVNGSFGGTLNIGGIATFNNTITQVGQVPINISEITSNASGSPTCVFTSGGGTGFPGCTVYVNSTNSLMARIQLTTGSNPSSSGSVTFTFAGAGFPAASSLGCIIQPTRAAALWNPRVSFQGQDILSSGVVTTYIVTWDNNSVNLTSTIVYSFNMLCWAQ
jgi:hypothetical protein